MLKCVKFKTGKRKYYLQWCDRALEARRQNVLAAGWSCRQVSAGWAPGTLHGEVRSELPLVAADLGGQNPSLGMGLPPAEVTKRACCPGFLRAAS